MIGLTVGLAIGLAVGVTTVARVALARLSERSLPNDTTPTSRSRLHACLRHLFHKPRKLDFYITK